MAGDDLGRVPILNRSIRFQPPGSFSTVRFNFNRIVENEPGD
jgi:hypothetical protein